MSTSTESTLSAPKADTSPAGAGDGGAFSGRFLDTVEISLDTKGRASLPAAMRAPFSAGAVLTVWAGPCVAVFTPNGFDTWMDHLAARLRTSGYDDIAGHYRFAHADAASVRPDVQGRFILPDRFRHAATIDREITVVGAGNRVELWNPATYGRELPEYRQGNEFFMSDFGIPEVGA